MQLRQVKLYILEGKTNKFKVDSNSGVLHSLHPPPMCQDHALGLPLFGSASWDQTLEPCTASTCPCVLGLGPTTTTYS